LTEKRPISSERRAYDAEAAVKWSTWPRHQVTPPESFTFKQQEWPKWIRHFERFRSAAGLAEKAEEVQVNTLIYTMGDEADDILSSFKLMDEDKKDYKIVKKFEAHFVKWRNNDRVS